MTVNFSGSEFGNKAAGFDQPIQLPRDEDQRRAWQAANRAWWESTPMRYDWRDAIPHEPGTEPYFRDIDSRFLSSVRCYLPWRTIPFEQLIPFDELGNRDVLEIGVGQGTHAQLIAAHARSFTGVDLTTAASRMTARRMRVFNLPGRILQMDAESMALPDASFDFIWSWGVIHHSANTRGILQEMHRVLRPGGRATVMVYHRSWWHFRLGAALRGVFQGKFRRGENLHTIAQGATDGAIARYYTPAEWRRVAGDLFDVATIRIYGLKVELLPIPHGRIKSALERLIPDGIGRFMTNRLRLGTFLVAEMRKPA